MRSVAQARKLLDQTVYELDGIIAVAGVPIVSVGDNLRRFSGHELRMRGLDLVRLIEEDYLIPVTNQHLVEEALMVIKEASGKRSASAPRRRSERRRKQETE
ncbi:MAG: hypothetical protein RML84_09240 [Anaerolineae bacterium]|nr:hypothetical protein [Anaerolineae bacterium]